MAGIMRKRWNETMSKQAIDASANEMRKLVRKAVEPSEEEIILAGMSEAQAVIERMTDQLKASQSSASGPRGVAANADEGVELLLPLCRLFARAGAQGTRTVLTWLDDAVLGSPTHPTGSRAGIPIPNNASFTMRVRRIVNACSSPATNAVRPWPPQWNWQCMPWGNIPSGGSGHRFDRAIRAWACGETSEVVRETIQLLLLGPPGQHGTGCIPKAALLDVVSAAGLPTWRHHQSAPRQRRHFYDCAESLQPRT